MKYALFLSLMISNFALAKTPVNFNQALNDDLRHEIEKDDFKFKKKSFRAPASVKMDTIRPLLEEPQKIDKNLRQIGSRKW